MDPITVIVTALSAGVASALQDDAKAAYSKLRDMLKKRLAGRKVGELALAEHESAPRMWEPQLRAELAAAGAENDPGLVDAAAALLKLIDEAGARAGKYDITVKDSQGVQVGDHNIQINRFGA
jgi:RIP homotypic interaction motif (RHIM)-containing protein